MARRKIVAELEAILQKIPDDTKYIGQKLVDEASHIPADTRLTEATLAGSVEALKNTSAPMSWCAGLNTLQNWGTMKTSMTELFEGKFATGLEYCQYLDTLAG